MLKKISIMCFFVYIPLAFSQTIPSSLKNNNCVTCHTINKKLMGPSWKDIANKYKSNQNAMQTINQSISSGSSNKWGGMPMPASPQINQEEVTEISKWILQQ